ncbi:MAG: STAS domain-containing protein [Terriglobales bacterium]
MSTSIDEARLLLSLKEALPKIDGAKGEVVLDFSSVQRLDSRVLQVLKEYAAVAHEKEVKIILRGVNASVYKVLTLVKLTRPFSFVN